MSRRQNVLNRTVHRTTGSKRRQLIRLFAALMLLGGVLTGLVQPAAARSAPERIDGNTYNGLDYGWSLTWDDSVWDEPYEEHSDGTEYVVISTVDEPYASGRVDATNMFGGDVDACVSGWDDMLRAGGTMRHIKATEVDSGIDLTDGAAEGAYSLDLKVEDQLVDFVVYVQCRPFGDDANLVLTLGVMPDYYEEALPLFADLVDGLAVDDASVLIPGDQTGDAETGDRPTADEPTWDNDDSETSTPIDEADSGIDGDGYTGVNFNWSVTWDGHLWKPIEGSEDNSGGVDSFAIASVQPFAPVAVVMFKSTAEYDGDVDACAEGGWDWLEEGGESMTDIAVADVELPEVPSGGAVMAYSYTFDEGNGEPVDFIALQECLPLDSMGATLVVHGMIPVEMYDEALPFFTDLADGISIEFN